MAGKKQKTEVLDLLLRNMVSSSCIHLLRREFKIDGVVIEDIQLGRIQLVIDSTKVTRKMIEKILETYGFEILADKEKILVGQIRQAVIELVHHTTYNAMVRNSEFLVERFSMSYPYLSSLFSRHENITLEKFIILHKIEKVKEPIEYGDLTLSEIAFMMGYSSVQYLSTQFKSVTGISVSDYKSTPGGKRKPLDKL